MAVSWTEGIDSAVSSVELSSRTICESVDVIDLSIDSFGCSDTDVSSTEAKVESRRVEEGRWADED